MKMSVNSSGSHEDASTSCYMSRPTLSIVFTMGIVNILFLPVFLFVLGLCYKKWRASEWSHADAFACHDTVMLLITTAGYSAFCYGVLENSENPMFVGSSLLSFVIPGQTVLRVFTCLECYLAVVRPVTYRSLQQAGGVRIRNLSLGCVWLSCSVLICFSFAVPLAVIVGLQGCILFGSVGVASFCILSVLRVLVRPGPGHLDGKRKRVDRRSRRALHTIVAVLGTTWLRFVGLLGSGLLVGTTPTEVTCATGAVVVILAVPSNLILLLLFLHRADKFPDLKKSLFLWQWQKQ